MVIDPVNGNLIWSKQGENDYASLGYFSRVHILQNDNIIAPVTVSGISGRMLYINGLTGALIKTLISGDSINDGIASNYSLSTLTNNNVAIAFNRIDNPLVDQGAVILFDPTNGNEIDRIEGGFAGNLIGDFILPTSDGHLLIVSPTDKGAAGFNTGSVI